VIGTWKVPRFGRARRSRARAGHISGLATVDRAAVAGAAVDGAVLGCHWTHELRPSAWERTMVNVAGLAVGAPDQVSPSNGGQVQGRWDRAAADIQGVMPVSGCSGRCPAAGRRVGSR